MPAAKTLIERNQQILDRMNHLQALEMPLERIFLDGKRAQLLAGVEADGVPFARLAPSTLRQLRMYPQPLVPRGASSLLITEYRVQFYFGAGKMSIEGWWPMSWVVYHKTGGRHLPKRDPYGFRPQDVKEAMRITREYIFGNG